LSVTVNGRQKGAAAEREIAKLLLDELGIAFKRDLEQYRAAEHGDLICDDPDFPFCIEVKRYKAGCAAQPAWWDQACAAARACQKLPLLVYKYNHQQWKWRMPAEAVVRAGMPIEYKGCRDTSALDWGYAVEVDTRTAMMLIREMLVDA
jgi:Holliday junction resolvase